METAISVIQSEMLPTHNSTLNCLSVYRKNDANYRPRRLLENHHVSPRNSQFGSFLIERQLVIKLQMTSIKLALIHHVTGTTGTPLP